MDNPDKPATTRRKTKRKHNAICVGHHYAQANTNKVNKTRAFLQTTGGKDEPTIVFILSGSKWSKALRGNLPKVIKL